MVTNGADGAAFAIRRRGTGYGGEEVVCLWVSRWVTWMPARTGAFAPGRRLRVRFVFADGAAQESLNEVDEEGRKFLPSGPMRVGMLFGGETGLRQ